MFFNACLPLSLSLAKKKRDGLGLRADDANGVGDARRLLHAGILLEDFEGGDEEGKVLQSH